MPVRQQWVTLLGAIAGMNEGRSYLSMSSDAVLEQLCAWLEADSAPPSGGQQHVRSARICKSTKF